MWVTRIRNSIISDAFVLARTIALAVAIGISTSIVFALIIARSAEAMHSLAVHQGWVL